jgi:citrate synthase
VLVAFLDESGKEDQSQRIDIARVDDIDVGVDGGDGRLAVRELGNLGDELRQHVFLRGHAHEDAPVPVPNATGCDTVVVANPAELDQVAAAVAFPEDASMKNELDSRSAERIAKGLRGVFVDSTAISNIDELPAEVLIRGVSLDEALAKFKYAEFAYLLLRGHMASDSELDRFNTATEAGRKLSPRTIRVLEASKGAHPLEVFRTAVSTLESSFEDDDWDFTVLASLYAVGENILGHADEPPREKASLPELLLRALRSEAPPAAVIRAAEQAAMVVAEHGANNSTYAARLVASTGASVHACLTAAIASFGGPLHGAAVELVFHDIHRLAKIRGEQGAFEEYRQAVRAGRLRPMGFGHAIYSAPDPRAERFRVLALSIAGPEEHALIETAQTMVQVLSDLQKHGLSANCDLFASIAYSALGFPAPFFGVVHSLGRAVGWLAHIREQRTRHVMIRPRFKYVAASRQIRDAGP